MASVPKNDWSRVASLYESGLSMRCVAAQFKVSIDAITYVLRKQNVARRSAAETNRIAFDAKPPSFGINASKSTHDRMLTAMGAMLYWAEGYDTDKAQGVDFANCDPDTVKMFLAFLRTRYTLDEKRLRIFLYCYTDQDIRALIKFWSTALRIPQSQFTKPYVRRDFRPEGRRMPHGLVHVRYSDKKLLLDIRKLIESYVQLYCVGGRVVNYTAL